MKQMHQTVAHRAIIMAVVMLVIGAVVTVMHAGPVAAKKKPEIKPQAAPSDVELRELLEPTLKDEMHLIIEHYLQAAVNFSYGKYDNSILHLKMMEYYIDFLPDLMPTQNLDGTPINKDQFKANVQALKAMTERIRGLIEKKKYDEVEKIGMDHVVDVCLTCHATVKVPSGWETGKAYKPD